MKCFNSLILITTLRILKSVLNQRFAYGIMRFKAIDKRGYIP